MSRLNMRRGLSVSLWIWIIGGFVVATITLTLAMSNVGNIFQLGQRTQVVDSYYSMTQDIKFQCEQAKGARKSGLRLSLKDVRALYASDNRSGPPERAPQLVSEEATSEGNYVCMKMIDGKLRCEKMQCEVNMTYMGRPLQGTDMYRLGAGDGSFSFDYSIVKERDKVSIRAKHVP